MRRLIFFAVLIVVCMPAVARAARMPAGTQLASIESTTEKIRHLTHTSSVKVEFPSNAAFDSLLTAEMHRDDPDSEIALAQKEMVLQGLLGPRDDLRRLTLQGLGSLVLGFYDPHHRALYVRNQPDLLSGPARSTVAHEYTHALQDEHYHLLKLTPSLINVKYRNSDALVAHHALTEGDAVNTQYLYIFKTYSAQDLAGLTKMQSQTPAGPALPKALQSLFYFPYTTGLTFVRKLYQLDGMRSVDGAYARLPSSTYEIMHPTAYLNHWKPVKISLHAVEGFAAWQVIDDDVYGALQYDVLMRQYLPGSVADRVTSGYRGDRYVTLEKNGQDAMLLQSAWADYRAASSAKVTLLQALRKRFPRARVLPGAGTTVETPSEAVYLRVSGPRMTVAYAPTSALALQLGVASTT